MALEGRVNEGTEATGDRGLRLPRTVFFALAGLAAFAAIFVAAGLLGGDAGSVAPVDRAPIVAGASATPESQADPAATSSPTAAPSLSAAATATATAVASSVAVTPTATALAATTEPATVSQSPAPVTPTAGEPATATPVFTTPSPAPGLSAAAAEIVATVESQYGVRVITAGQDWGADQAQQVRNLTALSNALASLPEGLRAAVVNGAGGPLTFLSNNHGRTEDGWQPYGDRAANYYANEDNGPGGRRAAHQIVLQTGSTAQTIAHEIVHAYQLRDAAPGDYVAALLTPEMKAFMAATGWRQLVPDEVLRASADQSWETVNQMFIYEGRPLTYITEFGTSATLYAPNPMEGWAEAAGLYYARSAATPLPDWPEYWAFFDETHG